MFSSCILFQEKCCFDFDFHLVLERGCGFSECLKLLSCDFHVDATRRNWRYLVTLSRQAIFKGFYAFSKDFLKKIDKMLKIGSGGSKQQ